MEQNILLFKSITQDEQIDRSEIVKFLNWGKGDIQQALNYYYKHLQKGKIKRNSKQIKPQVSIKPRVSQKPVVQDQRDKQSQMDSIDFGSEQDFQKSSNNAFDVLRKGSIQHKKTYDFIKHVRQIYKLPIRGKTQKQLLKNSKSQLAQHQGQIPNQFKFADSLNKSLNSQGVRQLMQNQLQSSRKFENKNYYYPKNEPIQSQNRLIELSISQQARQQQQQHQIQVQGENSINQKEKDQQFINIQSFDYKHVYSRKQSNRMSITQERKPAESSQQKANKNTDKANVQQNEEQKYIEQSKKSKQVKAQQEKQLLLKKKNPRNSKSRQQINIKNDSKNQLVEQFNQYLQKAKKSASQLNFAQVKEKLSSQHGRHIMQQDQIYVGQYFARGLCTQKRRYQMSCYGQQVKIQTYIEELKTKKKKFGKKGERNMNMKILMNNRQIGRIADEDVRVIMPLIHQELIRVQFFIKEIPLMADLLNSMTLTARVYFLRKLITEPIIQTYQPKQEDKQRVDQLSALLTKLGLPILKPPLIKAKSKYIRNDKAKKQKSKLSFDLMKFNDEQQKLEKMNEERQQKNKAELQRYRSDPHYKQKQTSLQEMIKKNQENLKLTPNKNNEVQYIEEHGQVKKKIIEIDTQAEKSKLSQLIQLHEQDYEPYFPKNNFLSQLYQYQALALSWMLHRQGFLSGNQDQQQLHPLWTQYGLPAQPKYKLYFNQLTGQLCIKQPTAVIKCKGGILADEMGLGKTVMMTALIVSNPLTLQARSKQQAGTLVIVPLTLLSQWQSQIAKHTSNQKVTTYYSTQRKNLIEALYKYDVVISTYGTISHQYAQGLHTKKQGIYRYKWHRIILDEAHYIKGRIIQTSKSVYELNGTYRWCLTGTPIQNTVTDIFSLLHFIKYTPWSQFACWNRFIVKPFQQEEEQIYPVLRTILKKVFLRRTKMSQGADGKPIIELPPRISKIQLLTMSQKQRQFYNSIYQSSRSSFDQLIERGILQAKYMQVLEMLMRLRQICCHPILFKAITKFAKNTQQFKQELQKLIQKSSKKYSSLEEQKSEEYFEPIIDADNEQFRVKANPSSTVSQQYLKQVFQKITNENLDNCIICLNQPEDPIITCCLHIFCKSCNIRQIQQKHMCSFCRRPLDKDDFIFLPRQDRLNLKTKSKSKQQIFPSTKMIALNQYLSKLEPEDKAVVFSQFLGMLDLLQQQLISNKIKYVRMQGSNTHKERTKIVKAFQQDPTVQVFLVSLKTAGVGLNLVAANKVFLMDPWWNPAVQEQAIQRVHRIGQKRQVQIYRFIIDKTIETRMLQLNTQKKMLSQNVLNQNLDKDSTTKHKIEKLRYLMENY